MHLLPARYALEPGADLIQIQPTYTSAPTAVKSRALPNGTPIVAGYVSSGTTGLHTSWTVTEYEGFAIYPSGYAQKLSAYTISNASSYFSAIATAAGTGTVSEPADAGTFTVSVTPAAMNALDIEGTVLTAAASGGRGAQVNVSAPDLTVTSGASTVNGATLAISGTVLQSWNESSLTLGGVAMPVTETLASNPCYGANCTDIAVGANNVVIDSGVQLTADQIEIVAQQSITVQSGAALLSTSGMTGTPLSTLPSTGTAILTTASPQQSLLPQAALLAVSDLSLPVVCRSTACIPSTGVAAPTSAATSSTGATITAASGSTLSSGGALSIDAPGDVTLAGTLNGKGASWSLSSGSVAFVASGASADTLNIGSGLLANLQQAGAVRIASLGDIDIDTPVSLGVNAAGTAPTLSSLTLVGNSITSQTGSNAMFGGTSVTLLGNVAPDVANPAPPGIPGSANLSFVANTLNLGAGVLQVNGFQQTTAQVSGAVETRGAGVLNVGGSLTINAAELTAAPDAVDEPGTTIAATGTLDLGAPVAVAAGTTLPKLVGGNLTLTAADIEDAGAIVAPSGVVDLNASGTVHLLPMASIDTSGTTLYAVGQSAASPGGLVTLTSGGNLSLDAGSVVSVAGSASAPAGSLVLEGAGGTVTVAGTLNGAAAGNTGGSLTVNAGTLAGGLASLVANAGIAGFSDAVNVRVHTGDLDLASTSSLMSGSITLTADSGTVDIAGVLSAPSGAQRGLIDLSGGTGVTLESTGQLHADGAGTSGRGGEIDLSSVTASCRGVGVCTSSGFITLDAGSVITASGASEMGELVLRAPALTATNDVVINQGSTGIGANISQAGQVVIEPVVVTSTSSGRVNVDLATAVNNASAFLSGGATQTIATRLTGATTTPVQVQAGVELQDSDAGDALSVGALDLMPFSTQGNVINLALRAAGSITLTGVISDGFISAAGGRGTTVTSLTNQASGSFPSWPVRTCRAPTLCRSCHAPCVRSPWPRTPLCEPAPGTSHWPRPATSFS
jgi:filamentous hemagglutinin